MCVGGTRNNSTNAGPLRKPVAALKQFRCVVLEKWAGTQDGGQLRPHPVQHGADEHRAKVERKHADVPQDSQPALLPGAAATERRFSCLCTSRTGPQSVQMCSDGVLKSVQV